MTTRTRLTLYAATFLIGLLGVLELRGKVNELSQRDYAEVLLGEAFAEIGLE